MSEIIKTPLDWYQEYIDSCNRASNLVIPSVEGFITYLEDGHNMRFEDACVIAEEPIIKKRMDIRAIATINKMISMGKGRNSRELLSMIDGIKGNEVVKEDKITIVIEESDKEV